MGQTSCWALWYKGDKTQKVPAVTELKPKEHFHCPIALNDGAYTKSSQRFFLTIRCYSFTSRYSPGWLQYLCGLWQSPWDLVSLSIKQTVSMWKCLPLPYAATVGGFQNRSAVSSSAEQQPSNMNPQRQPDARRKNLERNSLSVYLRSKTDSFQWMKTQLPGPLSPSHVFLVF